MDVLQDASTSRRTRYIRLEDIRFTTVCEARLRIRVLHTGKDYKEMRIIENIDEEVFCREKYQENEMYEDNGGKTTRCRRYERSKEKEKNYISNKKLGKKIVAVTSG